MKEITPETEARIKALEEGFIPVKAEIKQLMLDIRALVMEASSPLKGQIQNTRASGGARG
jgi:hypothetical protein